MAILRTMNFRTKHLVFLLIMLLLLPASDVFASTNGTIEVQALVQEGFIEPITVELSGKDDYNVKLLVTKDNGYVLRKQLPNGTYKVELAYTNTKAETDSRMWASTETLEIQQGKTTVLNVAVLDDGDGDREILFGEENNPFGVNSSENPEEFMKENAEKLSGNDEENEALSDTLTQQKEDSSNILEENIEPSPDTADTIKKRDTEKSDTENAFGKLIDLLVSLAKYILLSVFVMAGVTAIVWVYRRYKYGE